MNKDLDKAIKDADKRIIDIESKSVTTNQQPDDIDQQRQKIYELGRLSYLNEHNRIVLAGLAEGYQSNEYYMELEQKALEEMKAYEEMTAIAKANAAKAGVSGEELDDYNQKCKQYYLEELKKEQDYQKNIKIVIGNDGITCTNELTGEVTRYDIFCNPLTE
jgi:stress response protein YsnF